MAADYSKKSIALHKKYRGKLSVESKLPLRNKEDLSLAYTPGVAAVSLEIFKKKEMAKHLTATKNSIAILTDGSAVLGLGDIGPLAALPVMEGKAILFKRFAGIDAFPIVLGVRDTEEIISCIRAIAPTFGGINLEDISAPRCFEIEERLKETLDIPVMHDDQHGTAVVVLAGILNALKVTDRKKEGVEIVINGAGAAGVAIAKLLHLYGFRKLVLVDSSGIISPIRRDLSSIKKDLLTITNPTGKQGSLLDALRDADVFIGVSKGNILKPAHIAAMNKAPIIFALANPTPEIMPAEAHKAGASIVATGRSDFPNQVNNVLAYPGIFKGALEGNLSAITDRMKIAAAEALAKLVKNPTEKKIIPDPFDRGIVAVVAEAVKKAGKNQG